MDTLVKLTTDVWDFGCKNDVVRLTAERLKALEEKAVQMGQEVFTVLEKAEEKAEVAVEAEVKDVETKVEEAVKGQSKAADAKAAKGAK